jgi:hypothetical protein
VTAPAASSARIFSVCRDRGTAPRITGTEINAEVRRALVVRPEIREFANDYVKQVK